MSKIKVNKRAEEKALETYPAPQLEGCSNILYDLEGNHREGFVNGYEQGQKETIERAVEWLKEHAKDYIVDLTPTYPDAPVDIIVGGKCWDDLKEYIEDE